MAHRKQVIAYSLKAWKPGSLEARKLGSWKAESSRLKTEIIVSLNVE
jgi:hypothetical protein